MKKIILIGCTGAGKTTLMQALSGRAIEYNKTQYISNTGFIVDTPGEYAQAAHLGRALAIYTYEADIVGLLVSATEQYCIYPPGVTSMANRETIGIVTQIDKPGADTKRAIRWLRLAGCLKIFEVNSKDAATILPIIDYLKGE